MMPLFVVSQLKDDAISELVYPDSYSDLYLQAIYVKPVYSKLGYITLLAN